MLKKIIVLFALLLPAVLPAAAGEIRISAAASMKDALTEITAAYARAHPGVSFAHNFAASGTLARQIALGGKADIFISAHPKWMKYLVDEKRVSAENVRTLAGNTLVFVGRTDRKIDSIAGLPKLAKIAIGSPRSTPAGEYAVEVLRKSGIYEELASAGKLVMAQDVRQALVYADRGEVDGAFVYRTDAPLAREAKILFEVPQDLYPPIICPVGLTAVGAKNPAAVAVYEYLKKSEAKKVLEKYGFAVR